MIDWGIVLTVLTIIAILVLAPAIICGAVGLIWFVVSIPYLIQQQFKNKNKI
jgi:hypothetical protein